MSHAGHLRMGSVVNFHLLTPVLFHFTQSRSTWPNTHTCKWSSPPGQAAVVAPRYARERGQDGAAVTASCLHPAGVVIVGSLPPKSG